MGIDWLTVVTSVLGSGVVAACVSPAVSALREHSKRKANGRMVALTAALVLEKFGSACAAMVGDTLNYDWNDGFAGKAHNQLPPLQPVTVSAKWNGLPLRVASMLLEFEASVEQANIDLQDELAADHFELAMPIFLRLGEKSFAVAGQVREIMKLPQVMSYGAARSLVYLSEQRAAFERQDDVLISNS